MVKPKRSIKTRGSYNDFANSLAALWGIDKKELENHDYNYKEYYSDNPSEAYAQLNKLRTNDPTAHFPDTYKLPTHPTFSVESKYSGKNGNVVGGTWKDNPSDIQRWTYQLSPSQRKNHWNVRRTLEYAGEAEDEGFKVIDDKGRHPVVNGIIQGGVLPTIIVRPKYKKGGKSTNYVTTGGAGYIPPSPTVTEEDLYNLAGSVIKITPNPILNKVRYNLYDNLTPVGYSTVQNVIKAAVGIPDYFAGIGQRVENRDDLFAEYLGIPRKDRHNIANKVTISPSNYKPTKRKSDSRTFRIDNLSKKEIDILINTANNLKTGENTLANYSDNRFDGLGRFTIGRGHDLKGDYASYYDTWDLTPFGDRTSGGGGGKDQSFGIGTPFDVYDRVYFDDYYGVPDKDKGGNYIPEIVVTGKRKKHKDGGSIHIAPSKRGTFTAAATKRGIGVQEFAARVLRNKEEYSPSLVKKANFVRNASKWNH